MALLPKNKNRRRVKSIQTVEYYDSATIDGWVRRFTWFFLVLLAGIAIGYAWAAKAYGADGQFRCNTVIIEPGDAMDRVVRYCGAPDERMEWTRTADARGILPRSYNGQLTRTASRSITEFHYERHGFDLWLLFKDDVLVGIREGARW